MLARRCSRFAILSAVCLSFSALAAEPQAEDQKPFYMLGVVLAENITNFNLTPAELELVKAGLTDGATGKASVNLQVYGPKLAELQKTRVAAIAAEQRKVGQAFADKVAKEPGATKTPSGIVIKTLSAGKGASPTATDTIKVHYHGTTPDGRVFDSSVERKEPISIPLGQVIPCWTEALQTMKVGGKSRIVCPADTAYGDRGTPNIKAGSTLVFDVELLEIEQPSAASPQ
jgi:FKBP-type peptidyl-prolyl cis-trans isomerase FkpA